MLSPSLAARADEVIDSGCSGAGVLVATSDRVAAIQLTEAIAVI
jgi:hypothetical protein